MDLYEHFERIIDALNAERIAYAVCGGVAVNIHGHFRATRHIDLLVQKDDVERVRALVRPLGFTLPSGRIPFSEGTPQARELWRVSRSEGASLLSLDLMVVSRVYEPIFERRVRTAWRGRSFDVVDPAGLIEMKRLAGRPQDLADIAALERGATP